MSAEAEARRAEAMMLILTSEEVLRRGLQFVGYDDRRQQRCQRSTNLKRFRANFGAAPIVYAQIWEDLLTTKMKGANIIDSKPKYDDFLLAIYWLRCYPTEQQLEAQFGVSDKTARKYVWYYTNKIAALKKLKVCFVCRPRSSFSMLSTRRSRPTTRGRHRPPPLSHRLVRYRFDSQSLMESQHKKSSLCQSTASTFTFMIQEILPTTPTNSTRPH